MTDVSGTKGAKGEKFLKKEERQQCWNARDNQWQCFDKNGKESEVCQGLRKLYTELCPPTWVTHFDRKYDYNKFKETAAKEGWKTMDADFKKQKQ